MLLMALGLALGLTPATHASDLPPELAALPPVGPDYQPIRYRGRVVQITKTSVFIQHQGYHIELPTARHPDGISRPVAVYRQDNKRPFHEFKLDPALFPNQPGTKALGFGEHYATEVRIGDVVKIINDTGPGVDTCTGISILRRPGGKVPPAWFDDKLDERNRHDVRKNAEQFIEERVIPTALPRLFLHMHR